jgi:hypothetical protein
MRGPVRYLAPKLGVCLTLLVAWPLVGPGSNARAECLRIQGLERLDSSQLYSDGFAVTDSFAEVGAGSPAFETSDDANPGDAPDAAVLFARLHKLLASLGQQALPPTRGSSGTGAGSTTGPVGQQAGLFTSPQVPCAEKSESLHFENMLVPPTPFISGLIDPPRFASHL